MSKAASPRKDPMASSSSDDDNAAAAPAAAAASPSSDAPATATSANTVTLAGMTLKMPPGWSADPDGVMTASTTTQMQRFVHASFANADPQQSAPGEVPMIILSVEDLAGNDVTSAEYMLQSVNLQMEQLTMMMQGQARPTLTKPPSETKTGPFTQVAEVSLSHPMISISNLTYTAVAGGFGYTFQLTANPANLQRWRPSVYQMCVTATLKAGGALLSGPDFAASAYISYPLALSKQMLAIAGIEAQEADAGAALKNFVIHVPTTGWMLCDKDSFAALSLPPQIDKQKQIVCAFRPSLKSTGAVLVLSSNPGAVTAPHRVVAAPNASDKVWLLATDAKVSDELLGAVAATISDGGAAASSAPRLVSAMQGLSFDLPTLNAQLQITQLDKSVVGVLHEPAHSIFDATSGRPPTKQQLLKIASIPQYQLRVGTPESDCDCKENLEGWITSLREAGIENAGLREIADQNVVYATQITKEDVGMGVVQMEMMRTATYIVLMNGRRSCLIKIDVPSEQISAMTYAIEALVASTRISAEQPF